MSLFEDTLGHNESLFNKPGVLDPEYLPKLLPYREEKQKYLSRSIKQIPNGGTNYFLHGPTGVGKSASVRHVLRDLRKSELNIAPAYVNCWEHDTFNKILKEIFNYMDIPSGDLSQEQLLSKLVKRLSNYEGTVMVFDEIDQAKDYSFLYNLSEKLSYKSIWLISTQKNWYSKADERIRSRLSCNMIEFSPYSKDQIEGILEKRRKNAFVEGVWNDKAFKKVVEKCHKSKDVRVGLGLMRKSGQIAESEASREITLDHVKDAINSNEIEGMKDSKEEVNGKNLKDF